MSSEEQILFIFLIGLTSQCKINTTEGISMVVDDGGPLEQRKRSIYTDCPCTDSGLQGPSLHSPTPPSKMLALTWQCDIWLHVAYGV